MIMRIISYPRSFTVVNIKGNGVTRTDDVRKITAKDNEKIGPKIDPWGTPDVTLDRTRKSAGRR